MTRRGRRAEEAAGTLPIVTIAKLRSRARGAGSELALACDMRFAGPGERRRCPTLYSVASEAADG